MISLSKYSFNSRARSSIGQILAFSLLLSLLSHGLFFKYEWLSLGMFLTAFTLMLMPRMDFRGFEYTDVLFICLILLSILGLTQPVRAIDGIFDAQHWGIFWLIYRLARQAAGLEDIVKGIFRNLYIIAFVFAIFGWIPLASKIWLTPTIPEAGRLSSWFGYPNAAAAFLGTILLLSPKNLLGIVILTTSLISTGSRGAIGLFIFIFIVREFVNTSITGFEESNMSFIWRRKIYLIGFLVLLLLGLTMAAIFYKPALTHLWTWGFSSSSWLERLAYYKDGIMIVLQGYGLPQAGGWWAFPLVQQTPYWSSDPHSSLIKIMINQGIPGVLLFIVWGFIQLRQRVQDLSHREGLDRKAALNRLSAIVFLVTHSLFDVDFSFGALGILFWILVGIDNDLKSFTPYYQINKKSLNKFLATLLVILLFLTSFGVLVSPTLFQPELKWSKAANALALKKPEEAVLLWQKSLKRDKTQVSWRQEYASLLITRIDPNEGLKEVEKVLSWRPYDVKAYEWAQGVVWSVAETKRKDNKQQAIDLYRWVEQLPALMRNKPSLYNELMAYQAKERQLTLQLP